VQQDLRVRTTAQINEARGRPVGVALTSQVRCPSATTPATRCGGWARRIRSSRSD